MLNCLKAAGEAEGRGNGMRLKTRFRRLAVALALAPLAISQLAAAPAIGPQWPTYNNRLNGQRYSPLKEITPANAARLGEVCRVQVDGPAPFHSALIVVDGVIYANSARETVAVDATTCALRWRHTYTPEEAEVVPSTRGPAVLNGRLFRGTGDGRLIALDAATGRLLWKNVLGDPDIGEFVGSAPLAWQGVVYAGVSGGDKGIRGRVMAFDAATGKELWRFNTIPMGKETGAETWTRPETARTGGGGVWGAYSLDVTTGELFVPVGNPWPDIDIGYRPGKNLFTNSIVVLDARTGALKWWYQSNPEDPHDLDLSAAPVIYRNKTSNYVAFAGKDGHVLIVDRDTHKLVARTAVTTIVNPGKRATPEGTRVCPGFAGGVEWNGPTLDPDNRQLITGSVDWCFTLTTAPTVYDPPTATYGGDLKPDPNGSGWVTALDNQTGAVRWRFHDEKPVIAGVTPTAGGVTFTGDLGGNLLVLNSKTGELVHKQPTGGALAGGVVTYEIGGRQYVAAASGNVSRNAFGVLGLPSIVVMALDAKGAPPPRPVASGGPAGTPDAGRGKAVYTQICASCHGADGDMIADHRLSTLKARRDFAATVAFVKAPTGAMPRMFPELLTEQNVADVAAYVQEGPGR